MAQNVIVAENLYSEFKNSQVWQVAIQVPSGKKYGRKDILEPLKALRYMFMLQRQHHFEISKACIEQLKLAYEPIKQARAKEKAAADKEKLFEVAEQMVEECATLKEQAAPEKKHRGRPRKAEKKQEEAE